MIKNNYSDDDYKYIGIINVKTIDTLINRVVEDNINYYSLCLMYLGHTYIINYYKDKSSLHNYELVTCVGLKSKFNKFVYYEDFINCLKNIFNKDDILVLLYMLYEKGNVISYPVTTDKLLSSKTITRSDELYLNNMKKNITFKHKGKTFLSQVIFCIINIIVGIMCLYNHKEIIDILFGLFTSSFGTSLLIYLIIKHGYKTSLDNGFLTSKRLFKTKKVYNFSDIKYIDDITIYNLFNTKKRFNIYMSDNSLVKLDYYNNSLSIQDDELNEVVVYLKEQLINKKIKINVVSKSNKIIPIVIILIYIALIIIL